jgi:hypothetical protein
VSLQYAFDLYEILPATIWEYRNDKYEIRYREFYSLLKELLDCLNNSIKNLNKATAEAAAIRIKDVCDLCFDSFLHDVYDLPAQQSSSSMEDLLAFHDKKNRRIQWELLELRSILLEKDPKEYAHLFGGWMNLISVMQIYDDLLDAPVDSGFQDNLLLFVATRNFPAELKWFYKNRWRLAGKKEWPLEVSMNMPCSVHRCLQIAKMKMNGMNLTQLKISNYLWQKNWFVPDVCGNSIDQLLEYSSPLLRHGLNEEEWKSYALELCFHDKELKKNISRKLSWRQRFLLRFCFIYLNNSEKSAMLNRITGNYTFKINKPFALKSLSGYEVIR